MLIICAALPGQSASSALSCTGGPSLVLTSSGPSQQCCSMHPRMVVGEHRRPACLRCRGPRGLEKPTRLGMKHPKVACERSTRLGSVRVIPRLCDYYAKHSRARMSPLNTAVFVLFTSFVCHFPTFSTLQALTRI